MTATVLSFATGRRVVPAPTHQTLTPTVPCPSWCQGNCAGGEVYDYGDGRQSTVDTRLHERRVYNTRAYDDMDGGPVGVLVTIERTDTPAGPGDNYVALKVGAEGVRLTRQQRIELAAALLTANEFDDDLDDSGSDQT